MFMYKLLFYYSLIHVKFSHICKLYFSSSFFKILSGVSCVVTDSYTTVTLNKVTDLSALENCLPHLGLCM